MIDINRVTIIGRLGRDPETRNVGDTTVTNMSVATSEKWKDKATGGQKEQTEWHRVAVFGERLQARKGDRVAVTGKLVTRKWTDNAGAEKVSTEIVVRFPHGCVVVEGRGDSPARVELDDDTPF